MDGEATDDIEMEEERTEQEAAEQEDEEDTYADDQRRDESILDIDGSDPVFTRLDDEEVSDLDVDSRLKRMGKSDGKVRRSIIHNKKQFLRDGLGITLNKDDGDSTRELYKELRIAISEKTNKINGATYKGKKVLYITRGGKMKYSESVDIKPYVDEFKELLRRADIEHQKTPAALVERRVGVDVTQDTMDSIIDNVSDRIDSRVNSKVEDVTTNTEITDNELRELRGILNVKGSSGAAKLEALKVESDNWKEKAEKEGNTRKGKLYEAIADVADLKADELRLRLNQKPKTEEVTNMVEEEAEGNDLTRFEKFKKWSRENLVNLSAAAISVAGIITTVVMAGRGALKKGGDALGKLGKAAANVIKKIWLVLAPLGTLIVKALELGGRGLSFLSKNLWILVLALTYFTYSEYISRRRSGR